MSTERGVPNGGVVLHLVSFVRGSKTVKGDGAVFSLAVVLVCFAMHCFDGNKLLCCK